MDVTINSTRWQMIRSDSVVDMNPPARWLGDPESYQYARIPFPNDPRWVDAPTNTKGQLEMKEVSRLPAGSKYQKLDFTYFCTYVNIPEGFKVTSFQATIANVDDGARMYVFNDANPGGLYRAEKDGRLNGFRVTSTFETAATSGWNMVLIVQFDNCPVKNELTGGVEIKVNDKIVPVDKTLAVPSIEFAPAKARVETYGVNGQGGTANQKAYWIGWNASSKPAAAGIIAGPNSARDGSYAFDVAKRLVDGGVALEVLNFRNAKAGVKYFLPDLGPNPTVYTIEPPMENKERPGEDSETKFLSLKRKSNPDTDTHMRHSGFVLRNDAGNRQDATYRQDCTWRFHALQ